MVTEKICKRCSKNLPPSSFYKQSTTKDGLRSWCKCCTQEYCKSWKERAGHNLSKRYSEVQKRFRRKNREYIRAHKSKPCNNCGITLDPVLMDFDHLHSKSKNVSAMSANSRKLIDQEIAKCQILCIFCHKEKTYLSKKPEFQPTSPKKYSRYISKKWKQYFAIVAKSKPCYVCDKSFPHYQMELDHQPQFQKIADVSKLIFHMADDLLILKEIGKCKPICCACHRIKSINEKSKRQLTEKWQYIKKKKVPLFGNKFCPQCYLEKKIEYFSQNGWCKACFSRYRKERRKVKKQTHS